MKSKHSTFFLHFCHRWYFFFQGTLTTSSKKALVAVRPYPLKEQQRRNGVNGLEDGRKDAESHLVVQVWCFHARVRAGLHV